MRHTRLILSTSVFVLATTFYLPADEQGAIAEIEKIGGTVRKIAQNTDDQEAAFHLSGKDLTDDGLVHLKEVSNLVWLNLANTKITDEGLRQLSDIKTLKRLHLENTQIGDAGLAYLAGLENLEYLNLYGTQVSDAGLEHLKGLKNLKKLYLWQSNATPAGAEQLKDALANVDINLGAEFEKVVSYDKLLAKGQYVRVRLEGDKRILQLAEVQVFEKGSGEELQKIRDLAAVLRLRRREINSRKRRQQRPGLQQRLRFAYSRRKRSLVADRPGRRERDRPH